MADINVLSDEQENNLAGALLKDPSRLELVSEIIKPENIRLTHVRDLFNAMLFLNESGLKIDTVTVGDELERHNKINDWGGRLGLRKLRSDFTGDAAESYAVKVKGYSAKREMYQIFTKHAYGALNGRDDYDVQAEAIREIADVETSNPKANEHLSDAKETISTLYDKVEEAARMYQKGEKRTDIIPTGFYDLDDMYGDGMEAPDFLILAGRPGKGKSGLLLSIAYSACKIGKRALLFGLEMSNEQTIARLACMITGIEYKRLKGGKLEAREWELFNKAIEEIEALPLELNDMQGITPNQMRQTFRKVQATKGDIDLVIVDYIQLMGTDEKYGNRELEVSSTSRGLKRMCKEFHVPVLAAAQLSRKVEERKEKKPILSDLRESGSLEQDADSVWFIHPDEMKPENADLVVAKHRNGEIGTVPLRFIKARTKFESATKRIS